MFLFVQAVGLFAFGVYRGYGVTHSVLEASISAAAAAVAMAPRLRRSIREVMVTSGLMSASAILVHLSGGTIEAHFHFFVMVSLVTLYQSWVPFLTAIAYVVLHHGVMGTLDPESVYNHPAAIANPVKWAAIHGFFVFGASIAGLIVWKRNEELRERDQRHVALNRSLDAFTGQVAHDLKAPLSAIRLATSAGAAERRLTEVKGRLSSIDTHASRAIEMINGLLELARAGEAPAPEPVDVTELVASIDDVLPGVDVELEATQTTVIADPVALRVALTNLLDNARRYAAGPRGVAHVGVSVDEFGEGWRISVADRGPGVPTEQRDAIFEPFARGDAPPSVEGTGLGLSIVAAMARAQGGSAGVEPRRGGGSVFWLYLPRPVATSTNGERTRAVEV